MKKAFIDDNGVLIAHGYMASNNNDRSIDVADDFNLELRRWRREGNAWVAIPPSPSESEIARQAKRNKLDALGNGIQDLKDFIRTELL